VSRQALVAAGIGAVALFALASVAVCQKHWEVELGAEQVWSLDLSMDRFGIAPALYWSDTSGRLLVVPERLVPLGEPSEATGGGEILVVDPATRRSQWRLPSADETTTAVSVAWEIPKHIDGPVERPRLSSFIGGEGPVVELSFGGAAPKLPSYNLNIPPFGEPGWRFERHRFGQARLEVKPSAGMAGAVVLTRRLLNSTSSPDLDSLAAWLPGGRFLVLNLLPEGERRVLLVDARKEPALDRSRDHERTRNP
jgi:hypothetical protein